MLELEMETLEERRHQIDMQQTFKILRGQDKVDKSSWLEMAASTGRVTRLAADPLNLKVPVAKLEVRRNFYSHRIPEAWNQIPAEIKQAKNARCFRNQHRNHRHGLVAAAQVATRTLT